MFLRGFERDGAKTSGFFKLQKIRTGKNIIFDFLSLAATTLVLAVARTRSQPPPRLCELLFAIGLRPSKQKEKAGAGRLFSIACSTAVLF